MTATSIVVGLISDTHGLMRPRVAEVFTDVALILHAGDVGGASVLAALNAIAPTEAVYGNVDDPHDPSLARQRALSLGGVTIHMSHGHELGHPTPDVVASRYAADVLVFGHTHRAVVAERNGRLVVNPGAAGPRRFNVQPSVARLTIVDGRPTVEIISL